MVLLGSVVVQDMFIKSGNADDATPTLRSEKTPRPFFSNCVAWPKDLMAAKEWLDDRAEEIDRASFLALVSEEHMKQLEESLGYTADLRMENDPYVHYYLEPETQIPYFVWSAIEHVFARPDEIEALDRHARDMDHARDEGVLVIDRVTAMAGLSPKSRYYEGDLQDEAVERIINHDGAFIIIEDGNSPTAYISACMEVTLAHAGPARVVRLHVDELSGQEDRYAAIAQIARDRGWGENLEIWSPSDARAADALPSLS